MAIDAEHSMIGEPCQATVEVIKSDRVAGTNVAQIRMGPLNSSAESVDSVSIPPIAVVDAILSNLDGVAISVIDPNGLTRLYLNIVICAEDFDKPIGSDDRGLPARRSGLRRVPILS